jgi:hypothetical protein
LPAATKVAAAETPIAATTELVEPDEPVSHHRYRSRHHEASAGGGDVCARHHLHKVTTGKGWRCR